MQVKRFVADDMRSAMRAVKEDIGAEAVILSNRVVEGKVEILAARDYDEALINEALDQSIIKTKPDSAAAHYERAAAERAETERKAAASDALLGKPSEAPGSQARDNTRRGSSRKNAYGNDSSSGVSSRDPQAMKIFSNIRRRVCLSHLPACRVSP